MERYKCERTRLYWIAGMLVSGSVFAQTPPDAGSLRQQIEQGREPVVPHQALPQRSTEAQAVPALTGVILTVKSFHFEGNTLLLSETLERSVAKFLNRPLDYAQLQIVTAAISDSYRAAGWIVRVYLPQQDVTDGVITLKIVEAVFGGVKIEGSQDSRVALDDVIARIEAQQKVGAPLNADMLDRALLLVGDLPGISVTGNLREGAHEGETELVLQVNNQPLVTGEVSADNTGARSTGPNRVTLASNLNSPLGLGDQASVNMIHSEGSDYDQLGYSLPVGKLGARANFNVSQLYYHLVGSDVSALNASGNSSSFSADLSYPLVRQRQQNLSLDLGLQNKTFHNEASSAVQSDYSDLVWTAALNGNRFDDWGGGGTNRVELSWSTGDLNQGMLDTAENPSFSGAFNKLHYTLARQQVVTDTLSLDATLTGQSASKDLDTSERFYLGGATGVRAYPSNEGGGSSGQLLNLELRQRLPYNLVLSGFYDWGYISNSASIGPSYELKGYGAALNWIADTGANVKLTYAHRDGSNPNPTAHGLDQDGSLVNDRWWLTLTIPFGYSPQDSVPAPELQRVASVPANAPVPALAPVAPEVESNAVPVVVPTATQTVAPVAPDAAQAEILAIEQTLRAWIQAWQGADVDSYLGFYAPGFVPAQGLSRAQWEAQRRKRIKNAGHIQISTGAAHVVVQGEQATVDFEQAYVAEHYHDKGHKTLQLRRSGAQWRIVSERVNERSSEK